MGIDLGNQGRPATVPTIGRDLFKDIMANYPAGVTVVTSLARDGTPHGMTVSAFCSVSLAPPLVLICVNKSARTLGHIEQSRGFTVNFLANSASDVAALFASGAPNKFDLVQWRLPSNAGAGPVLLSASAHLECRMQQSVVAGDHVILLAEAGWGDLRQVSAPLVHWRRTYLDLGPKVSPVATANQPGHQH